MPNNLVVLGISELFFDKIVPYREILLNYIDGITLFQPKDLMCVPIGCNGSEKCAPRPKIMCILALICIQTIF